MCSGICVIYHTAENFICIESNEHRVYCYPLYFFTLPNYIYIVFSKSTLSLQLKLAQYRLWMTMILCLTFIQEGSISFLLLLSHVYDWKVSSSLYEMWLLFFSQ